MLTKIALRTERCRTLFRWIPRNCLLVPIDACRQSTKNAHKRCEPGLKEQQQTNVVIPLLTRLSSLCMFLLRVFACRTHHWLPLLSFTGKQIKLRYLQWQKYFNDFKPLSRVCKNHPYSSAPTWGTARVNTLFKGVEKKTKFPYLSQLLHRTAVWIDK